MISLISTGASRLCRSFLCTQRKLISTVRSDAALTRIVAGMPEMKATSLPEEATRTPQCQTWRYPGGCGRGQRRGQASRERRVNRAHTGQWQRGTEGDAASKPQLGAVCHPRASCGSVAPRNACVQRAAPAAPLSCPPAPTPHLQRPAQELLGVGKAEHVVVVLNLRSVGSGGSPCRALEPN